MVFIMLLYIQIILFLELSISLNELYPYFWKFFQIFEVFFWNNNHYFFTCN